MNIGMCSWRTFWINWRRGFIPLVKYWPDAPRAIRCGPFEVRW